MRIARVDLAAEWILDHVEEVHGTRDLCEVNSWYEDGICDPYCADPDPDCEPEGDDDDTTGDDDASADDDDTGPDGWPVLGRSLGTRRSSRGPRRARRARRTCRTRRAPPTLTRG